MILRTKEHLSVILPHKNALILSLIHFKDELREEGGLDLPNEPLKQYKISDSELKMAVSLIQDMAVKWEPEKYHNLYRETLMKWIEKKTKEEMKRGTKKTDGVPKNDDVIDFISLLKQSMKKSSKDKSTSLRKKGGV